MKKVKVWLDSGANIHSRNEDEFESEEEFGFTEEEWNDLSPQEQFETVIDYCYGFDWGVEFVEQPEQETETIQDDNDE